MVIQSKVSLKPCTEQDVLECTEHVTKLPISSPWEHIVSFSFTTPFDGNS